MQQATLIRYYNPFGIHGELSGCWDKPIKILERPWKGNAPRESCIPEGTYTCKRVKSPTYGNTFEVTDVQGRTHILFHWGNWVSNSLGCLLTGEEWDIDGQGLKVNLSKAAHKRFMAGLETVEEFQLTILPFTPEFP